MKERSEGTKKRWPGEGDLPERTALAGKACSRAQVGCTMGHILNVRLCLRAVILKTVQASESPEGFLKTAPLAPPPELGVARAGAGPGIRLTSSQGMLWPPVWGPYSETR